MSWLADFLRDPSVEHLDVDGGDRLTVHSEILSRKRMLRDVFAGFHHIFDRLDKTYLSGNGMRLEIGAGIAQMKSSYPDVLSTDVVPGPGLDRTLDAENMDLDSNSVRVVFGQNCFHHFPHPDRFFVELERVLQVGGGAVLLEPYHGFAAAFVFKRLFHTEGYDKHYPSWETPVAGPMNGANQALSYIVFRRDRAEFTKRFPNLKIVHEETCSNYLKYLLSGGLNFRQLCPDWAAPLVSVVQFVLRPLNRWFALHHVVVLRKES